MPTQKMWDRRLWGLLSLLSSRLLLQDSLGPGLAAEGLSCPGGQLSAGTFTAVLRQRGCGAKDRMGGTLCSPLWLRGRGQIRNQFCRKGRL